MLDLTVTETLSYKGNKMKTYKRVDKAFMQDEMIYAQ